MRNHKKIAGAIFDFAAFLTILEYPYTISRNHDSSRMVDLIREWSVSRGLNIETPFISAWHLDDAELRKLYPSLQEAYEKMEEAEEEYELVKKLVQDHEE